MISTPPSFFYKRPAVYEWILRLSEAIAELGNNTDILDTVLNARCIKNYEGLYRKLNNLTLAARQKIDSPWQLFVLSGETDAFNYAVARLHLDAASKNSVGQNALHVAALSGNFSQIEKAQQLGIKWNSESDDGCNLLHYAIMSGNFDLVKQVFNLNKQSEHPLALTNKKNQNVLHFAASTGINEIVNFILDLINTQQLAIKKDDKDDEGYNALNYAIKKGNVRIINKLSKEMSASGNQETFHYGDINRNVTQKYKS